MSDTTNGTKDLSPVLVVIRGIPGSGKSHLATALFRALGTDSATILDPDMIDTTDETFLSFSRNLSAEGLDEAIHPFRWLRKTACEAIAPGHIIIWNQPFTIRGIFDRLVQFLQTHAESETDTRLSVLVVEITIDPEKAKKRIAERKKHGGHGPLDAIFEHRVNEYESFADGYHTVTVSGEDDVAQSTRTIIEHIHKLQDS